MADTDEKIDSYFFQLVMLLQAGAMQQMGKIASPITGKIERNLNMAKNSIDLIGMLQTKTAGNLTQDEKKLIDHVLYELRLNYVDEANKDKTVKAETKTAKGDEQAAPSESESPKPVDEKQKNSSTDQSGSSSATESKEN
ncbi:MAG: DUF1844 domain-containing protein [Candidatus Zixiibacteriota bacterium]